MKDKKNKTPEPELKEEKPQEPAPEEAPEEASAPEEPQEASQETSPETTIEELRQALEAAEKQRDDYLDSLRRSQAEFQNFRRRNQTSRSDGYQDGVSETMTAVLPAIDNLERALEAARAAGENDKLVSGVEMTLTTLLDALKKLGLEEVPAQGENFDPELHNAVMKEAAEEPGKVLEVFQKGYRLKGKILRYAMVKVASE